MPRALQLLLAPFATVLAFAVTALAAWPLLLFLLAVDLCWWPFAAATRRRLRPSARDPRAASIVTVSWNGRHHLERLLPSLRRAVELHGGDHETIVVDNGSTDGTVAWLAKEHPWVKVVALPENRYFVRGNRAGVEAATRDVLVFLNNDMVVAADFLGPLLEGLRDPLVFAVTAEVFFADPAKRREETGRTRGEVARGALRLAHLVPTRDERELAYAPALWAGGGSSAYDRSAWLALGGFDDLYHPFYVEDAGLSYAAWKRGYRVLFTARSSVVHEHRGTSRKAFGDDFVDRTIRRNLHLLVWRNVTDPRLLAKLLLPLPFAVAGRSRPGRGRLESLGFELRALSGALPRLPRAVLGRCAERRHAVRGDAAVLRESASLAAHRAANDTALGRVAVPDPAGLRLLVLAGRLPRLATDGSWVVVQRLAAQAKTHRVTLFAFAEGDGSDEAAAAELRAAGIEVVLEPRVRNRTAGNLHHLVPWRLWRDYAAPPMRAAVRRVLEGTDHDIVQIEYVEMLQALDGAPKESPWVYTCHESQALATARRHAAARGLLGRVRAAFLAEQALGHELRLLRRCDRVVALSPADAAFLARHAKDLPIDVVPSGVDAERVPGAGAAVAAEAGTILFVGYFKHAPNVDAATWLAREVLPKVRERAPSARVVLVGREAPPAVQALAGDGVEVRGFVPDLDRALASAEVVALPLRQGSGLRGKLLEAWSAKKPVVATPIACEGTDAVDGEHCLVAADTAEFTAALVRLLADAGLRKKLGESGHALVRARHSPAAVVAGYERAYATALAAAAPRRRP